MTFSASEDDFDFDNPTPLTVAEVEALPDLPDEVFRRYAAKFGETFDWYQIQRANDQNQIDKVVKLMQSALAGDRGEISNDELKLQDLTETDLNAEW